ncbi:uncharacterized protein LOC111115061 [Crassostrea virginica]
MFQSTKYTTNFARLCRLVSICVELLRDVLRRYISEVSLYSELDAAKAKLTPKLYSQQKDLLYRKRKPGLSYDDLDITLLYTLIRNLCDDTHNLTHGQKGMSPPQNGWGKLPSRQDRSLAANVERIRYFRNETYHRERDSVMDNDFIVTWNKMRRVVEEIEKKLNNQINPTKYVDILKEIKDISMDPEETQKYIEEIERMKREQECLEEKIHKGVREELYKCQVFHLEDSKMKKQVARTCTFIEKESQKLQQYFVETKASSSVIEHLCASGVVIVKGNPGDGKTTLSVFIMKLLKEKGKIPLQIRSPSDWDEFISPNENLLVFIDNIFGEISVSQTEVKQWSSRFPEIQTSVGFNVEGNDNMAIITIRNDIYEECKKSLKDESFFQEAIVDISDKDHKLSMEEMGQILEKYVSKDVYQSSMIDTGTFFNDVPNLGFPQCCRLFKDNIRFEKDFPNFFKNPLHFLKEYFKKYIQNKEMKMAVLLFVLLQGGKVEKLSFEKQNKDEELKTEAMKMCKLCPDLIAYQRSIFAFTRSYLTFEDAEECYKFSHSSVESSLFLVLGDICDVNKLIKSCAYNQLRYLTSKNCPTSMMETLMIDKENFVCVSEKVISLVETRNPTIYACLAELILWNDEKFFEVFLETVRRRGQHFLSCIDEESKSMIVYFAAAGNVKWVEYMYENSKESKSNQQHYMALNAACEHNQFSIVNYLLNMEVQPDIKSCFHAVKGGSIKIIKLLADSGVDLKEHTYSLTFLDTYQCTFQTFTVLNEACSRGQNKMVLDLLNLCPDLLYTKSEAGESNLCFVAYSGDTDMLKIFIDKGLNPFEKSHREFTILHFACENGKLGTFLYIVQTYPELLNIENDNTAHGTLLSKTAEGGNVSILKQLVENGKDIYSRTTYGRTVLHLACEHGRIDMCKYLINKYPKLLHILDSEGLSPIHFTGFGGNVEILELLCSNMLTVQTFSNTGQTILHCACGNGSVNLCKYLIRKYPFLLEIRDFDGMHVVHYAAQSGNIELFKFLVNEKKEILYFKTDKRQTVLHQAAFCGNLELSKYLLEIEPNFLSETDADNGTVLHYAACGGDVQLFKLFVEMGVDPTFKDTRGQSALCSSCYWGKLSMCKYLIAEYSHLLADLDDEGYSVAHEAASSGNVQLLTFLQEKGVNLQLRTNHGHTTLHLASENSHIAACKYLLKTIKSDSDDFLKCKDVHGKSVLHFAAMGGYVNLFEFYISKGLSICDKSRMGKTVLNYAARFCCIEMCKHIIAKSEEFVWHIDNARESVLHDVARGGSIEIFEMFIDLGLDVERTNATGETVLHIACSNRNFKFCDYVFEKFPQIIEKENNKNQKVVREKESCSFFQQTRYKFSS